MWEQEGKINSYKTSDGHRRYIISELISNKKDQSLTIAYAHVSSHDPKQDVDRQCQVLEAYCPSKGFEFELISDVGSELNYKKKGLIRLIKLICSNQVEIYHTQQQSLKNRLKW